MMRQIVTMAGAAICFAAAFGCYDFSRYIGPYSSAWGWITMWAAVLMVVEGSALICLSLGKWR